MRRVVITGIGVITPIGTGKTEFWTNVLAGVSGIRPIKAFDTNRLPVHLGGEVQQFDPAEYVRHQDTNQMGRSSQLAVGSARLAIKDSGIDLSSISPMRQAVSMGTTMGEPLFIQQFNDIRQAEGCEAVPAEVFRAYPSSLISTFVSREFGMEGPSLMIPNACAAGNFAIGYGFDLLRLGRADLVLAGGSDAFSRIAYVGFARLGAIAPEKCQPFDQNRKGMVPGEGSATLVLESLESAVQRRATIYAEVLGYGASCDAHHMTAGHPEADGAIRAMASAMRESRKSAMDIDYISAHGTGTPSNDRMESLAVRTIFGHRADKIPISSIKSMLGHTMGAASAIEAATCALAIDTGWIPPTINHETPDPDCGLDVVANEARLVNPHTILNNAYAFGGNNASLCLSKYAD